MGRITIEMVREELEKNGWKLVSEKYTNLNTELQMICPKGHSVFIPYGQWRKDKSCPICNAAQKNIQKVDEVARKPKKGTRVLAIDQATYVSGWAIFDDDVLIQYSHFKLEDLDTATRIHKMKEWLLNMISNWKPDHIAFEDIQLQTFGGNKYSETGVTTYKVLAQLLGVLIETCVEHNIKYEVVHSAKWRSGCGVTGKSRTDKKRSAQLKVENWYDIKPTQDEADAICIGRYTIKNIIKDNTLIVW